MRPFYEYVIVDMATSFNDITITACERNVAEEIVSNAISACSREPRFDPIRSDELKYLDISVDVLGKAEKISSKE